MIREPERARRARRASAVGSFRLPLGTLDTVKRARIDAPRPRARDVDAVEQRVSKLEGRVEAIERKETKP